MMGYMEAPWLRAVASRYVQDHLALANPVNGKLALTNVVILERVTPALSTTMVDQSLQELLNPRTADVLAGALSEGAQTTRHAIIAATDDVLAGEVDVTVRELIG